MTELTEWEKGFMACINKVCGTSHTSLYDLQQELIEIEGKLKQEVRKR